MRDIGRTRRATTQRGAKRHYSQNTHFNPPDPMASKRNRKSKATAGARKSLATHDGAGIFKGSYLRDVPDAELHLIDTGHFALEDKADEMVPPDPKLPRTETAGILTSGKSVNTSEAQRPLGTAPPGV